MWSVPLVAAFAVVGVLAAYVMLAPNGAFAHEAPMHGAPGPVTGLDATVATGNDADGQPAGRTQIDLTWMAPAATAADAAAGTPNAGEATSYRIDYSADTRVWKNLVGGEESDTSLAEATADGNCAADAADGMRCFTDMTLTPGEERHYRVFAVNDFGTSPVSIIPTYATATAVDYGNPSPVLNLTASTTRREEIALHWQAPTDLGGATLLFYCLAVGTSTAADNIPDLANITVAATAASCLNVDEATGADDAPVYVGDPLAFPTAGGVIVVDGDTTTYTHKGLGKPDTVSLYYRVYAVTDKDGEADTANEPDADSAVTGERRISLAASNTANGRTIAPLPSVDTSVTATPRAVTNLRYVVDNGTGDAYRVRLYWTHPSNYPPALVGTASATNPNLRARWTPQVSRWDPNGGDDNNGAWVVLTNGAIGAGAVEQWISTGTEVAALATGPVQFRVRYINDPREDPDTTDVENGEVEGAEFRFTVARASDAKFNEDNLPQVDESTDNDAPGLRFKYNDQNPTTWLDLDWDQDADGNGDVPTGYVIDVSEDGGTIWNPLPNARRPTDLGSTTEYTHKNVVPGKGYTYRVFGEFGGIFGAPAREDGSTRAGDLPDPVRGLKVEADGQKKLKLTWDAVQNKRGSHDIIGYLVQIAPPASANTKTRPTTADADWVSLNILDDDTTTNVNEGKAYTVPADTQMYTYDGKRLDPDDELSGGNIRWFRVFAINAENDADDDTGGTAFNVTTGAANTTPSPSEASPNLADYVSDDWAYGMTDDPNAPGSPSSAEMTPVPADLTAERASDTNLIDATDRGVLLLWNEPKDGKEITSYVIERKIGTGDWTPIGTIERNSAQPHTERTSFSDSREYVAGEDLYYRVGSRGSSAVGANYADAVMYPQTHGDSHAPPSAPTSLTTTSDSAGSLTATWTPGDGATEQWVWQQPVGGTTADGAWSEKLAGDATTTTFTGLAAGDYWVIAIGGSDGSIPKWSDWSNWSRATVQ